MVRIPTHRTPTHPGEMLLEEFLKPMGVTQRDLAIAINVPYQRVNEIINGKRGITQGNHIDKSKTIRGVEVLISKKTPVPARQSSTFCSANRSLDSLTASRMSFVVALV